ncbi:hypothetical protein HPB52_019184 [Rhipicephalus sanguineus]|uniref:Uncharacterized protein n=1 Tax=Rhipicephalus sanguineus TaxID=34632 RepID=A0A9D4TBB3_RHISA|nr:hypothetical protein HPB52_019184 [Rhipicephalus sanguineus]
MRSGVLRAPTGQTIYKGYKQDLRKEHDGTAEFAIRDAHTGAHSRRGDVEPLGYNLLQQLCCRRLWEDNLKNAKYATSQFLQKVAYVIYEDTPHCERLKSSVEKGILTACFKSDSGLLSTRSKTPCCYSFSPMKRVPREIILAEDTTG